jgi:hypothetical protein
MHCGEVMMVDRCSKSNIILCCRWIVCWMPFGGESHGTQSSLLEWHQFVLSWFFSTGFQSDMAST